MHKRSDERSSPISTARSTSSERREIEAWLDSDPAARDKLAALAQSAALVRSAFDEVMREPLPDRLIAAARGERLSAEPSAKIVPLRRAAGDRERHCRAPLVARVAAGRLAVRLVAGRLRCVSERRQAAARERRLASSRRSSWPPPTIFGSTMPPVISSWPPAPADSALVDVPATGDAREALQKISQSLPQEVRRPELNLKPWGLNFRGARLVVAEGRPAAQLMYTTDNKAIGPLTLIVGSSKEPDIPPTLARRQDVNLLYWRHQGRAYALVGQTDVGYLWGIANDVAWQLDAI